MMSDEFPALPPPELPMKGGAGPGVSDAQESTVGRTGGGRPTAPRGMRLGKGRDESQTSVLGSLTLVLPCPSDPGPEDSPSPKLSIPFLLPLN
jgi:hypothetical protein